MHAGVCFDESDNRVRRYAEALAKRGDRVDAIALRQKGQAAFEIIRGVNVYRIQERIRDQKGPLSYLWKLLSFFVRSSWILTCRTISEPYDLIHVHSVPDFAVFAAFVPRVLGARVILDIDIVPEFYASSLKWEIVLSFSSLLLLIEKMAAAFSNHVIISNELWKKKLTKRWLQKRSVRLSSTIRICLFFI